nr:RHS repeat-associated core domain-containing protein [uncultured Pseudomonas sp.]
MPADLERISNKNSGQAQLSSPSLDQSDQPPPLTYLASSNEINSKVPLSHRQTAYKVPDKENKARTACLFAVDENTSVMGVLDSMGSLKGHNYLPYGFCLLLPGFLGFNGQRADSMTGHYPLGSGYRTFMPSLMRFNSPDSMSPFDAGGLNAYAYCRGNPVNWQDASGHMPNQPRKTQLLPARIVSYPTVVRHSVNYNKLRSTNIKTVTQSPLGVSENHRLIALHGSGAIHTASLEMGIDPKFSIRNKYGKAFYASPDYEVANYYSLEHQGRARVFGVYAKDAENWVEGRDYAYPKTGWLKILEPAFERVVIREEVHLPVLPLNSSAPGVKPYKIHYPKRRHRRH